MRRILPALAFCVVALLSACSGGSRSPTEARTPAVSPTPGLAIASPAATLPASATQGPQDSCTLDTAVCNVAASALKAVRTKDYEWLLQNSQPKPYTCPGPSLRALGGPFPLCTGAAPGERRPGYAIAFLESEGAIYDINAYKAELQRFLDTPLATAADQYGPAATTLYSIACPAEPMPCRDRFAIVFSQRPAAIPERAHLVLYFESVGGSSKAVYTLMGPFLRPEWRDAALKGGPISEFPTPEGWPPIRLLHRLPPS